MSYDTIPGWFNFSVAYRQAIDEAQDGATFVEVGCWAGRSAVYMAEQIIASGKNITFVCVDHWLGSVEHQELAMCGQVYEVFLRNTEQVRNILGDRFQIIRSDSVEASKGFKNNSLDFVWLDAAHDEQSVRNDIQAWLPKVKAGGTLGGDDFPMPGVRDAVAKELPHVETLPENGWAGWRYRKTVPTITREVSPKAIAELTKFFTSGPEPEFVIFPDEIAPQVEALRDELAEHPKNISGYKIVHQGGHHDVWCNGSTHIRTDGGYVGVNKGTAVNGQFSCDCHAFRAVTTPEVPVKRKPGRPRKDHGNAAK